jgi:hypothetical protein
MISVSLDQLAERLKEEHLPDVARATGLPYNTLKNVREKNNPTWATLERLARYFAERDA